MNEENKAGAALEAPAKGKSDPGEKTPSMPPVSGKPKKKKSIVKRIIVLVVVLAVLSAATYFVINRISKKSAAAVKLTEASVTRGDITKTITGSGAVQPVEEYTVVPTVTGKILTDNITQGQKINQGDPLYSIDPTNAENAIKQDENALQKAQLSYTQSAAAVANLTVKSGVSGVVTKVYVKNGDQVQANAPIMEVQDASSLILTLPFNSSDAQNITAGESAQVTLEATGTVLDGAVTRVYTGKQIGANGSLVTNIDITLTNPGVIQSGATATAVVGGQYACNVAGTLGYITDKTLIAKTSGQVANLNLQAGDAVNSGMTVATLTNDSAVVSAQTAELQVQNAQLTLQNAQDALKNYNITSPISGTVIEKNSKAGDTIGNSSSGTSMAVIADMSSLVMTINVDELDILSIKVGQTAQITADALPGKTFTGQVTSVSTIGSSGSGSASSSSSSTGVTTYAVELTISDYGSLLPGMNVNAGIVIDSAKNVLLIPQQAVMGGGFVLKKISGTSASSAPQGAQSTPGVTANPQAGGSGQYGKGQYTGGNGQSGNGAAGNGAAGSGQYTNGQNGSNSAALGASASPSASGNSSGGNSNAANRMKQLQASIPAGYELVRVQLGLVSGDFAEVTSGLNEGDAIAYVTPTTTSSTTTGSNRTGLGILGGGANRPATGGGNYQPAGGGTVVYNKG